MLDKHTHQPINLATFFVTKHDPQRRDYEMRSVSGLFDAEVQACRIGGPK